MSRLYQPVRILFLMLMIVAPLTLFSQISDQEALQEAMKYKNSGMSQQQIFLELTKKGVTGEQLQRIQSQTGSAAPVSVPPTISSASTDAARVSEEIAPTQPTHTSERVYGQGLFSKSNLTFEPNMNLPTPANYVIGPGDEIIIDVWGDSEMNLRYKVAPDGHITVPGLGRIQLNGMQVEQATSRIRGAFAQIYSDLESAEPHTFLAISLGNLRSIQINVMGEVNTPGTYTLSSFATAFHALYAAGGINDIGSLRNIRVFRNGKTAATIDVYDYLMHGDNTGDINLQEGDIVMVDPYTVQVQITGNVRRPTRYELKGDETISDLIGFAGGFRGNAYRSSLNVSRSGSLERENFTLMEGDYSSFILQDNDVVSVGEILDKSANAVAISGAINRPGDYAIGDKVNTVRDLVTTAGGPTGDAFLSRVLLNREKEDLTRSIESIDLHALLEGNIPDIVLRKNDRLFVPSVNRLTESRTIYVGGEVQDGGTFSFADNMSVEDAILRAGGLNEAASEAKIDVYRRIKDPMSTSKSTETVQSFTFSLENGLMGSDVKSFLLEPYDQVVVRRSPGYEAQRSATISGQVLFGGSYAITSRDERLSSLVERAGGLTDQAYIKGARLMRNLTDSELARTRQALELKEDMQDEEVEIDTHIVTQRPVGIDLAKALKNPGGVHDIILQAGDVLTIPTNDGTVTISGGVLYPNKVTFTKNMKLGGYISQAGGYSRLAMKTKPFVVYQNGKVASGRWAKIEPGCEIVVPERPEREPMSLQNWVAIGTSVATLSALIANLLK